MGNKGANAGGADGAIGVSGCLEGGVGTVGNTGFSNGDPKAKGMQ